MIAKHILSVSPTASAARSACGGDDIAKTPSRQLSSGSAECQFLLSGRRRGVEKSPPAPMMSHCGPAEAIEFTEKVDHCGDNGGTDEMVSSDDE